MISKLVFILSAIILIATLSIGLILWKDFAYAESEPYSPNKKCPILVVYYSRSGNTEIMAKEIAKRYNAEILQIQAETYPQNYKGWRKASNDASDKVIFTKIQPEVYDLKSYKFIFIGSPIWWYRPAPPIWTFVEKNNFSGKSVVLFNTFNSRFKEENIQEFKNSVEKKGGKFIDHIYIRRGRVISQLSTDELINEVGAILQKKESSWGIK